MIQKLIIKWIFGSIFKAIKKKREWKKMEDYVKKPNELDKKVKELETTVIVFNKCFDNIEDTMHKLEKEAHPPIFSKLDLRKIDKRISKLEKKKRRK